jgi:hypothetical protein
VADDPKGPGKEAAKQGTGPARPSVERAMALRDVLAHAVEVEKETRKHSGPPGAARVGRTIAMVLSVPSLAFSVYSYVARPEFIWGARPVVETAERKGANLRFTMFLLSQRIQAQRAATGRLPATLADVRENKTGIAYTVVSDTVFELRAEEGGQPVVLRSDRPPGEFLGDAQRHIMGRGK